jgi:hypothetical protein
MAADVAGTTDYQNPQANVSPRQDTFLKTAHILTACRQRSSNNSAVSCYSYAISDILMP